MKNLAKVLSVLLVVCIAAVSCQKDEDMTNLEAKKGLVSINVTTDQMVQNQSAPGMAKVGVKRPESFPVFIDRMTIDAQAAAGLVSEEFTFTDEGEGEIQMSPYLGMNTFSVTAYPEPETGYIYDPENDGFRAMVYIPLEDHYLQSAVRDFRSRSPRLVFTGSTNKLITEAPETVDMNMTTLQGRLIASFEMVQGSFPVNLARYAVDVHVTTTDDLIAYPMRIGGFSTDPDSESYNKLSFGMMYLSNERCVAGKKVDVTIKIYELLDTEKEHLLKTITLTEDQAKKFEIIPGKDRYTKLKVSPAGDVFVSDASFTFTWDWNTQDDDITIE